MKQKRQPFAMTTIGTGDKKEDDGSSGATEKSGQSCTGHDFERRTELAA